MEAELTGWIIGWVVGGVVVVIVVALLLVLIVSARKIASQAGDILAALDDSRERTLGLWDVDDVNAHLDSIRSSTAAARRVLSGG
ncbi:MAG: hypothetical protein Q8Q52_04190 [Acidimicrobiia bacterium]|nr:hypothetical protein [Acidimicrobiia bacterium]